jgi:hypothetical protein
VEESSYLGNTIEVVPMLRRLLLLIGFWLVLAAIFALIASRLFRTPYDRLVTNGVVTEGWITLKEPDNHQNVRYSYVVNSETYSCIGHGGQGGLPSFGNLQVGQKVRVVYDKTDPTVSSLGDPAEHLKSGNLLMVWASILFPTFIMAVLWYKGLWRLKNS